VDGTQFDQLIKRLGTTRVSRLTALRGLVAGALAGATGVGLTREEAGAKKKNNNNNEKKIRICVCTSADPTTCKGQKKEKKKANKALRRNACAYKGRCQSGVSGCAATAPISPPGAQCQNNSGCGGGQVCEGGQCVDCTATSQCSGGQVCVGGRCQSPQPTPLTVCAPFTVEARWTNDETDHDTYVRVPVEAGSTEDNPFIDYDCNADDDDCEVEYPFVCVSQDATGPGDEITTFYQLINGTYQYWIEVYTESPAGDLTVDLRNGNGVVIMSWSSPANPSDDDQIGWHVFDVDGSTCIVTSVDQVVNGEVPEGVHNPATDVCPD